MERNHLESLAVDTITMIMLKWVFKKWNVEVWNGLLSLRIGQMASASERGN